MKKEQEQRVNKKSIAGVIFFAGVLLIGWGFWSGNFESILFGCILTVTTSPIISESGERVSVMGGTTSLSVFLIFLYWYFWGFIGDQFQWAIAYCVISAIIIAILIACTSTPEGKKNIQSNEARLMAQKELKNKLKELTAQQDWKGIAQEHGLDLATTEFATRKEINHIPELLHVNEYVIFFTSGFMSSDGEITTNWGTSTWLSVLTNKRVLFLDSAFLTESLNQHSIPLKHVQAVSAHQGFFFGKVVIETGGKRTIIDNAWKSTVKKFAELANLLIQDIVDAEDASAVSVESNLDKLKKLGELKEAGVITEKEFTEQKAKLLNGI